MARNRIHNSAAAALALLVMMTATSCAGGGSDTQKPPGSSSASSISSGSASGNGAVAGSITISYTPAEGWEESGPNIDYQKTIAKDGATFMILSEHFLDYHSIDDVKEIAKEKFQEHFEDIAYETDGEAVTFDGRDALKFVMTYTLSNMKWKSTAYYVYISDVYVYSVSCIALETGYDAAATDFEKMVSTAKFTQN